MGGASSSSKSESDKSKLLLVFVFDLVLTIAPLGGEVVTEPMIVIHSPQCSLLQTGEYGLSDCEFSSVWFRSLVAASSVAWGRLVRGSRVVVGRDGGDEDEKMEVLLGLLLLLLEEDDLLLGNIAPQALRAAA